MVGEFIGPRGETITTTTISTTTTIITTTPTINTTATLVGGHHMILS